MENREKNLIILGVFIIAPIFAIFLLSLIPSSPTYQSEVMPNNYIDASTSLVKAGTVCTQIIRADGTREEANCDHNLFYGSGANMSRDCFTSGGCGAITNISLCNQSSSADSGGCAVVEGGTYTPFDTGCGMNANFGTVTDYGVEGNWSISLTTTNTCSGTITTNTTRLMNATGSVFATAAITSASLENSDSLITNWSNEIS